MNINHHCRLLWLKRATIIAILTILPVSAAYGSIAGNTRNYDQNKAKLLGYIIGRQITSNHYYHEPLDDKLSRQAFALYLKQVDPRKLFFIRKDVNSLKAYKLKLDNEMRSGNLQFPLVAERILQKRAKQIQQFITEFAASKIDLNKSQTLELEPKKLPYCASVTELKDRWRRNITYQIALQYLDQQEIAAAEARNKDKTPKKRDAKAAKAKTPAALKKEAISKVIKSNRDLLNRILKRDDNDDYDRFFSVFAKAVDPHSSFMPPSQKEDFDIHMRGSLEGIGAVLQEEGGYVKVVRIIPGGAAYRQKQLNAEDVILRVAQADAEPVDITGMKLRDAVSLIRGKKGSLVRLTVKHPSGVIAIIPIVRDIVQLEATFVKAVVLPQKADGHKFGYIKIPSFYRDFQGKGGRNVTDDTRKALQKLVKAKIDGLIVDLRNNGGGALVDAVKIAGLFIDKGPVVQIRADGRV
ncbi:MAG: tail-specific protease, partial [Deltaproteobacteria bacterium]|nr:tail-specific protease [Deltaproteobacteria bacterium]